MTYKLSILSKKEMKLFNSGSSEGNITPIIDLTSSFNCFSSFLFFGLVALESLFAFSTSANSVVCNGKL